MAAATVTPGSSDIFVEDGDARVSYLPDHSQWRLLNNSGWYHDGYLHTSSHASATISFSFFGDYFWYCGDYNSDHGVYHIQFDNGVPTQSSSYSAQIRAIQPLFSQALDPGPHTVTVTNMEEGKLVVLDYFAYRPLQSDTDTASAVPQEGPRDVVVRADDASISYVPAGSWVAPTSSSASVAALKQGAFFSFEFTGEYMWYYSDMNNASGAFSVIVDGGPESTYSAYSATAQPVQLLYSRALSPGHHVATITNAEDGKYTGISYFIYRPTSSVTSSESSTPSNEFGSGPMQGRKDDLAPGAIVGIVIGCIGLIIFAIALFVLVRKHSRATLMQQDMPPSEFLQPRVRPRPYSNSNVTIDAPLSVRLPSAPARGLASEPGSMRVQASTRLSSAYTGIE